MGKMQQVQKLFEEAMALADDPEKAEEAWTRAIAADPTIAAAFSNRGVTRLARGDAEGATADLMEAANLERKQFQYASGFTLCALGNAQGGKGDWRAAVESYEEATRDDFPGVQTLSTAYKALALYELDEKAQAIESARAVVNDNAAPEDVRDDMRAALVGFLHATGEDKGARELLSGLNLTERVKGYELLVGGGGWSPKAVSSVADAAEALK